MAKIVLIDFDKTIASGNVEQALRKNFLDDAQREEQFAVARKIKQNGEDGSWANLLRHLKKNHHIAIVTANRHPHVIDHYLEHVVKLEREEVNRIKIFSESLELEEKRYFGKSRHIDQAVAHFENLFCNQYKAHQVVLIDDDEVVIDIAKQQGYQTVLIRGPIDQHLDEVNAAVVDHHLEDFSRFTSLHIDVAAIPPIRSRRTNIFLNTPKACLDEQDMQPSSAASLKSFSSVFGSQSDLSAEESPRFWSGHSSPSIFSPASTIHSRRDSEQADSYVELTLPLKLRRND